MSDSRRSTPPRFARQLWRALIDGGEWRHAGRAEYRFATAALNWLGWPLPLLRRAIGVLCIAVALLGVVIRFHPCGPAGTAASVMQATAVASAVVVGVMWIMLPWPSVGWALAFVAWADVTLAVGAVTLADPQTRLLAINYVGMIGLFVSFLLGWRVLLVHCTYCLVVIAAIAEWGVRSGGLTLATSFDIVAPTLTAVVAMPMVVQAVVEGGRIGLRRITGQSRRDPLTGLLNRRGLSDYAATLATGISAGRWMVVVVVDLDGFKRFNDEFGHHVGDGVLRSAARQLRDSVDDGGVARVGGDEFVIVATVTDPAQIDAIAQRCVVSLGGPEGRSVTSSVGIAAARWHEAALDTLFAEADAAMYQAKRAGRARSVTSVRGVEQSDAE